MQNKITVSNGPRASLQNLIAKHGGKVASKDHVGELRTLAADVADLSEQMKPFQRESRLAAQKAAREAFIKNPTAENKAKIRIGEHDKLHADDSEARRPLKLAIQHRQERMDDLACGILEKAATAAQEEMETLTGEEEAVANQHDVPFIPSETLNAVARLRDFLNYRVGTKTGAHRLIAFIWQPKL